MTKLTLSLDEKVIAKAKAIADLNGTSVSSMFSNYIISMDLTQTAARSKPVKAGRLTGQATGLICSQEINEKEVLESALLERYGL